MSASRATARDVRIAWLLAALGVAFACAAQAQPRVAIDPRQAQVARERETLDGVVAAALVGALSEQLGGRAVKLRLDRVDVQATSLRDRRVSGQGALQIDSAEEWIGFRFVTLYDAVLESAGYPDLKIGTVGPEGRIVPNDATLVRELEESIAGKLGEEFGGQHARLQLDRIDTLEAGPRYYRIDAGGIADFGRDGTAPVHVEGLYDRKERNWLRAAYTLDDEAASEAAQPPDTH
ncbi:MAG: hypothetical protein JF600_10370 [Xanthomonadales bacterium]|nr:hypothetical protein [Xanthomonadales bacterium]